MRNDEATTTRVLGLQLQQSLVQPFAGFNPGRVRVATAPLEGNQVGLGNGNAEGGA
jgi:hypothetical protein